MTQLSCAEARALANDLLDGGLTTIERSDVFAHIATCGTCPSLYRSLLAVRAALMAASPGSPPSAELRRKIAALIERGPSG
jgi:anti-sigma factor RsiW